MHALRKALSHPLEAWRVSLAALRGAWYRVKFRLLYGERVRIGRRFRVYDAIHIRGPGSVYIGDNFSCCRVVFKDPAILTHAPEAVVRIGSGNFLGGTQISCAGLVELGDDNLLANALITDTDMIPHENLPWQAFRASARAVRIGNNVWLGLNTAVLKGVTLESECVLGAGSVAMSNAKPCSLLVGVPARCLGSTRDRAA